jgi:acid phosphatase (class A)
MRTLALVLAALLACAGAQAPSAPPAAAAPRGAQAVPAAHVAELGRRAGLDVWALTGPCPAPDSPTWRDDLAVALWTQAARTPEEVRRAEAEVEFGPESLAAEAGGPLDAAHRPLTRALLADAEKEIRGVYGPMKAHCDRPRPYAADPRLTPAVAKEPSAAFPSGHATRGALYARLLAELAPARAEALQERGRQVGFGRVRAGVHWASDVDAGRRLGAAFAEVLLRRPEFRARVEEARAREWGAR